MRTGLMDGFVVVAILSFSGIMARSSAADALNTMLDIQQSADQAGNGAPSRSSSSDDRNVKEAPARPEYRDSPLVAVAIGCCVLVGVILVGLSIRASRREGPRPLGRM